MDIQETLFKGLISRFALAGQIKSNIMIYEFRSSGSVIERRELFGENQNRLGFMVHNKSGTSLYIAFSEHAANKDNYSIELGPNATWEYKPAIGAYTGVITWNPAVAADGQVSVTEFSLEPERRL